MITGRKTYELFGKKLIEKIVIAAPFKLPGPMPDEACFLYVVEGEIKYRLDRRRITIPAKDAVMLRCGNYFGEMINTGSSVKQEIIIVHFHPDILKKVYNTGLPEFLQQPAKIDSSTNLERVSNEILIQKYIEGLLFYFDNPSLVNEEILVLKLKEIVLLLAQTENAPVIQQILAQLFSPATFSFRQIVEDNIYSHLPVEQLARMINLSLSSFKREFKRIYNDTPAKYFRNKRLDKAAELLVISDQRISDISFACGFSDLTVFSKSFHQKFNTSPSDYRVIQKNKSMNRRAK